jgi:hypothetical protein
MLERHLELIRITPVCCCFKGFANDILMLLYQRAKNVEKKSIFSKICFNTNTNSSLLRQAYPKQGILATYKDEGKLCLPH